MALKERFLRLKQKANSISSNPLLNRVEDDLLLAIEQASETDPFVRSKKDRILSLTANIEIDFQEQLKTAFDEYSEALAYLFLKHKFPSTQRMATSKSPTPDFRIPFAGDIQYNNVGEQTIFVELKTMSFADGVLNYQKAMIGSLEAQIDIENQTKTGKRIAFGESVIQPWLKSGRKDYDPFSFKYVIEVFTEKINHNIKKGQYEHGDSVLLIDQQQLIVPNNYIEGGVPLHFSHNNNALVSGIQWNVAFGRPGQNVFRPLEFEGRENIEGQLNIEGILWKYDYIKAICFLHDPDKTPLDRKVLGLYRRDVITDTVFQFLGSFCDFINDEVNTNGWEIFKPYRQ